MDYVPNGTQEPNLNPNRPMINVSPSLDRSTSQPRKKATRLGTLTSSSNRPGMRQQRLDALARSRSNTAEPLPPVIDLTNETDDPRRSYGDTGIDKPDDFPPQMARNSVPQGPPQLTQPQPVQSQPTQGSIQAPSPVIRADDSDDDLIEVDPQEAAKLNVFNKRPKWPPPANQPAPGPHFGPGTTHSQGMQQQLQDLSKWISSLNSQKHTLLRNRNLAQQKLKSLFLALRNMTAMHNQNPTMSTEEAMDVERQLKETKQEIVRIDSILNPLNSKLLSLQRSYRRLYAETQTMNGQAANVPDQPGADVKREEIIRQYNNSNRLLTQPPPDNDEVEIQEIRQVRADPYQNQYDMTWTEGRPEYPFQSEPNVSSSAAAGYPSYYTTTEGVDESAQIKDLLENIRPDEEEEEGLPLTPSELRINLFKHQRMGLSWLLRMEESKSKGGILADDMGLGKTIQSIALMMAHKSTDPMCKTTLIVAPVSLLRQWANEINLHTKIDVSVGVYHGIHKNKLFKSFRDMQRYDVIMTSYSTLGNEFKKHFKEVYEKNQVNITQDILPDIGTGGEQYVSPFYSKQSKFFRVILDEAQNIKNKLTVASKAATTINSVYRFCLTGTPMQNSIDELYPLLRFLRIKPYAREDIFKARVSTPMKNKDVTRLEGSMNTLRALLRAILLRRSKTSMIDGKPILQLPKKEIIPVHIKMDPEELESYKAIETNMQSKAKKLFLQDGNFSNFLVLLLRLRQACCHSFLCVLGSAGKLEQYRAKHWKTLLDQIVKLSTEEHKRVAQELASSDYKDQDIKELDEVDDLELIETSKVLGETDGDDGDVMMLDDEDIKFTVPPIKNEESQLFPPVKNEESQLVPSIKNEESQLVPMNFADNQLVTATADEKVNDDFGVFTCPLCFISYSYHSVMMFPCKHKICEDCIASYIEDYKEDLNKVRCYECTSTFYPQNLIDYRIFQMSQVEKKPAYLIQHEIEGNAKGNSISDKIRKLIIKHDGFIYSAKMEELKNLINKIFTEYPGEKIIVFSQFTTFFDLLKIMFNKEQIPILRYDGTMSVEQKDLTVKEFYQNDDYKIMLTSLKAGNVGLTLNCASHVIIADPFWNPYVEDQAQDRAHRIGQTREVRVYKLVVEGTVEERIITLQNKKKEIINAALDEKGMKSVSRLSRQDLNFLFGFNPPTRPRPM